MHTSRLVVRRGVYVKDHLGTSGALRGRWTIVVPNVLANVYSDADAVNLVNRTRVTCSEVTPLIENTVVRQE